MRLRWVLVGVVLVLSFCLAVAVAERRPDAADRCRDAVEAWHAHADHTDTPAVEDEVLHRLSRARAVACPTLF